MQCSGFLTIKFQKLIQKKKKMRQKEWCDFLLNNIKPTKHYKKINTIRITMVSRTDINSKKIARAHHLSEERQAAGTL